MSQTRSYNNFAKEPTKRQVKQQTPKGCCCKRSQCIKNYCDCYQSMATCSIYCKCIGCRNTEERLAVPTPPKKSAQIAKRERAAALSAKAAAAAAKAGINIHLKPAPGSAAFVGQQFSNQVQPSVVALTPQKPAPDAIQLPAADLYNVITLPPPSAAALGKKPQLSTTPTTTTNPNPTPVPPKDVNIFKQPINAALLECLVIQAVEAEDLGLTEVQVGKVIFHEFTRSLKSIIKVYSS
ncbi:protein lin-54 homolog [Drosophila innubila]|uniref:protein lin-54 homolog n=1 Tax=Drosophila innubila TaxID=198719 RepID=UPI00148BEAE9|nr:protein lin-54 homolog [Drosophila innubila]